MKFLNFYIIIKKKLGDIVNPNIKREIILQHYQNPKNKGLIEKDDYIYINMNNESCIDEVHLMVKIEDNTIVDVRFDGEACAICTSSTSIMIDTLLGKTVTEAKEIITQFGNMIDEKHYDKDLLEQAIVYDDIGRQPNRKKCALLGWWGMEKVLTQIHQKNK